MTPDDLKARTKKFAVEVIRFARTTSSPDPIDTDLVQQLAEAASASASGYRAACRARSRADFIYKLGNAIEESDEAAFWLEVLMEPESRPAIAPLCFGRRPTS